MQALSAPPTCRYHKQVPFGDDAAYPYVQAVIIEKWRGDIYNAKMLE